ncbi:DUF2502 domain-containing protein [Klebsiella variicola]
MTTLKSALLALSILLVAPALVHADEITLLPAVKLQIGDRDDYGHYWDGDHWRNRDWWAHHYDWRDDRWRPHDDYRHHDRDDDDDQAIMAMGTRGITTTTDHLCPR